ncbi:hypothetical protein [Legionella sp. W05-934-2]|jgi:hypothetical protein|uniref:hypothetical protein n=1 Tax=Legionella sp. W05-934-2 TaxID=1198649 RepID=UPI0034637A04
MKRNPSANDPSQKRKIPFNLKLIPVGSGNPGILEMINIIMTREHPRGDYSGMNIFGEHVSTLLVDETAVKLMIKSVSCGNDFDRTRVLDYPNTDIFLLCFSVTDQNAFREIESKWIREVQHYCPDATLVLVGTNTHFRDNPSVNNQMFKANSFVSNQQALQYAQSKGMLYLECSFSADNPNYSAVSHMLKEAILEYKNGPTITPKPPSISSSCAIM